MNLRALKKLRLQRRYQIKPKGHLLEQAKSVESFCGLYFLIEKNEIVYIGQSSNVIARIHAHSGNKRKPFDSFAWLPCNKNDLDEMETAYISFFEPIYNGRIPQTQELSTPIPFRVFWEKV